MLVGMIAPQPPSMEIATPVPEHSSCSNTSYSPPVQPETQPQGVHPWRSSTNPVNAFVATASQPVGQTGTCPSA